MLAHLRANLWLLALSLVIGCVLYPAAVWVVGWTFFHNAAEGSLIDKDGKPTGDPSKAVGSTQIAQPFTSAWFFQSRPSATSPNGYNAAASGGSNYAASNPKLRGRVASLLGTISRYTDAYKKAHKKSDGGDPSPQEDLLTWYGKQPPEQRWFDWVNNNATLVQAWATGPSSVQDYIQDWDDKHPGLAEKWKMDNPDAKAPPAFNDLLPYFFRGYEKEFANKWPVAESSDDVKAKVAAWAKDHPHAAKRWKEANPDAKSGPTDDDLVAFFYQDYAKNPGAWPMLLDAAEWPDVNKDKVVTAVVKQTDLQDSDKQQTFFDTWYTEQVKAGAVKTEDFRQVPADMVTTSGSGLDPDISLANAVYQKDTVVPAYADKIATDLVARDENKNLTDDQKKKLHDDLTEKLKPAIGKVVDKLLAELASRPMFGLTGDGPLVNVLQLNLRLQAEAAKIRVP